MQALAAVVENLEDLDGILTPLFTKLGNTHLGFEGFNVADLPLFVEAIMAVLEVDLGQMRFTSRVRKLWLRVCLYITSTMRQGYNGHQEISSASDV